MTEIEEAVTRVGMSLVDSQIITAYGDGRLHAKNLISDLRAILSALSASQAEVERLTRERDALHLAICGGEDAPGYAASLSHETVLKVLADNYASAKRDSELAWDGETANTWKARATRAEGLLEEMSEALKPFAAFHGVLVTMGGTTPRTGEYCTVVSRRGEASITVEHLARAAQLTETHSEP